MIEKLEHSHVIEVEMSLDNKSLKIMEACDYYYDLNLTKAEVVELANDFMKLSEQMD